MELLKEPKNALASANLLGLLGSTVYFYKQLELIRSDMVKINQTMTSLHNRLTALEKQEEGRKEVLVNLNDQVKQLGTKVEDLPSFDHFTDLDKDLKEVVDTLLDNGFEVERPSQTPKLPTRREPGRREREQDPPSDRRSRSRNSRPETRGLKGGPADDDELLGEIRRHIG